MSRYLCVKPRRETAADWEEKRVAQKGLESSKCEHYAAAAAAALSCNPVLTLSGSSRNERHSHHAAGRAVKH